MSNREDISLATRFTQGIGLIDIPPAELRSRLSTCPQEKQGPWNPWELASVTDQFQDVAEFLGVLTFPATRHCVFANQTGSALVNNLRNGSDYAGCRFTRFLNCMFARIVNHPARVWSNGVQREVMGYEARIFELYSPDSKEIRHVACADDGGRWVFHTSGVPHPIEANFPYDAKRKSARFSEGNLRELSAAYGLPVPTPEDFLHARQYLLFSERLGRRVESCTIEEADDPAYGYYRRGMSYAEHMKTHATSVIHDLEKCVALNPAYRQRVEPTLARARQTVAGFKR